MRGWGRDVTMYSRLWDEITKFFNFGFPVFLVCNNLSIALGYKKNRHSSRFLVEHILLRWFRCTTFIINIFGFSIPVYARNRYCFERSGAGNEKCFKEVMNSTVRIITDLNSTVRIITDLDRTFILKYCR